VPTSLRRAGQLLWVCVALSVVLAVLYLAGAVKSPSVAAEVITMIVTAAILALLAVKIGAGRNWARWVFAVMYVFGSLVFALAVIVAPQAFLALSAIQQASGVVQFGLQTAVLVLTFVRASRQWFAAG